MSGRSLLVILIAVGSLFVATGGIEAEDEPWIITEPVVLTEPAELGHVIVLAGGSLTVRDLGEPGLRIRGHIWVWVEFPAGSVAEYSPPMPGFIESWTFPPPGSTGIFQTATVDRCETLLWPMLVRENSTVLLHDISQDNWIVVGFHLPNDGEVEELFNDRFYADHTLDLEDREFRLVNASIDTWNLYPQADAQVAVRNSHLGEILSLENSRVSMERTTIDGTGGFFGARDTSRIVASDCRFTCTIEASQESTIELRSSIVEPYPIDPTGVWTRFGAYDDGRLFADQTPVLTTPALGGRGLIAVNYLHEQPQSPPAGSATLIGSVAQFSLDPEVAAGSWRLEASDGTGETPVTIGGGEDNVEDDVIGTWSNANPVLDYRLQTTLADGLGRTLVGNLVVPGSNPRVR